MERNLISGFSVDPSGPAIFATASLISLKPGELINFSLSAERWCLGFNDPQGALGPCPDQSLAETGGRCSSCMNKSRVPPCPRCNGVTFGGPALRAGCVCFDHYVYLACYSNNLFKVGVTGVKRLERRICEQGAWAAIAIAAAGGKEVRRLETAVTRAGWPDRVRMLGLLGDSPVASQEAEQLLRSEALRISVRLPEEKFVSDGPFIYVADQFPLIQERPREINPSTDPLSGKVVGMRGGYLMLEAEEQLLAVSLRNLIGRELAERSAPIAGPVQTTLIF